MADRLEVRKTLKLFIGGQFPRSESGRSFPVGDVWVAQASRKDVRDSVKAARSAFEGWRARTAYNRGQILYRVAEMLEERDGDEIAAAVDRWVWYAGWTDKLHHVAGTVNPVAGPYFDFTVPEPVGVVGIASVASPPLVGLTARLAPVLAAGNTAVVVVPGDAAREAVMLAEVLATSDVPAGVVNILTGHPEELLPGLAAHLDVDSLDLTGAPPAMVASLEAAAADGVTRTVRAADPLAQSPYEVTAFMEMKTVWHPIGT